MAHYKALFVGEQKVKSTRWKSREDAASCIVRDQLSVVSIYECTKGKHYFDVSDKIAKLIKASYVNLPENVRSFLLKAAT